MKTSHYGRKIPSRLVFKHKLVLCLEQLGSSQTRTELAMHFAPHLPCHIFQLLGMVGFFGILAVEVLPILFPVILLLIEFRCKEL